MPRVHPPSAFADLKTLEPVRSTLLASSSRSVGVILVKRALPPDPCFRLDTLGTNTQISTAKCANQGYLATLVSVILHPFLAIPPHNSALEGERPSRSRKPPASAQVGPKLRETFC